ncbi:MAG: hydantoinase/oxoprolinase family protein, partial [Bacteroidia bacterium]|nr:hydantoinase/oxoprolinase family protein [Bacteroidia bacterium]
SNGGVVIPEIVKKIPAVTVLSGPAAAPTAGIFYSNLLGFKNCITVDMGGTSFDASLVIDNQCITHTEGSINRYKIALPSLDIVTIGAGGGSIGWIDTGGLLQMGPQSAGALPGPVCYNKSGTAPTCTDANLILGYLNPDFFAGGKIKLDCDKTKKALYAELSSKLGLGELQTASGMYRIINANMARGVRQVSIEKGYDPREFLFIVAGGAGPIHAGEICKELEISMFLVPNVASIFCAAGMLLGDIKHDYICSFLALFSGIDKKQLLSMFEQMKKTGTKTLINEGISQENIGYFPVLDMRYLGQYHEVQLSAKANLNYALKSNRKTYIPETDSLEDIPVYDGDVNLYGSHIKGPAIIEKVNTSIFISNIYDCQVDAYGSFIVYNREVYPGGYLK